MAEIIKGAEAAAVIRANIRSALEEHRIVPVLAVLRVGESGSDMAYERGVAKTCESVGIKWKSIALPETIDQKELEEAFRQINEDPDIHGILMLRPLPAHLNEKPLIEMMDPAKDMDCMTPANWAKLVTGDASGYYPCTAEAVIRICRYAGVDCCGAKAVVIGRSQVIGKPAGLLLLAENATVTWCHSRTKDLAEACKGAQILVSACGKAKLVGEEIARVLSPDCTAIDVGVNFVDGKMCGDFDFDAVNPYVSRITPVPGGVGAVTNTVLAAHVTKAAFRASGTELEL